MAVNHGSALGKEYFISYLSLIMNAKGCSAEEAKDIGFNLFFNGNKDVYGKRTYQEFLAAFAVLTNTFYQHKIIRH
jgi:hypothetical protein